MSTLTSHQPPSRKMTTRRNVAIDRRLLRCQQKFPHHCARSPGNFLKQTHLFFSSETTCPSCTLRYPQRERMEGILLRTVPRRVAGHMRHMIMMSLARVQRSSVVCPTFQAHSLTDLFVCFVSSHRNYIFNPLYVHNTVYCRTYI